MTETTTQPTFTEDWYSDAQLTLLATAVRLAPPKGAIVEVGCWEGRSTVALASACAPRTLYAIDHWQGNISEGPEHASVKAAQQRDVHAQFVENMVAARVHQQVLDWRGDWRSAMEQGYFPFLAFAHLDASHDYQSTYDLIQAVKARLVPGGVICGDDIKTAHKGRADLDGGVERAVTELLPGAYVIDNFWIWTEDGRAVTL